MNECFDGIDALLFATKVIDPSQYTNRIKAIKNKKDIDIISTSRKRKVTNFVSYSNLSFNSDDQDTFNKIQQEKKKKKKKHKHKNKFKNKSNHKHKEKEKEKFPFENEKSWTQTNYPKEYSFNYTLNKRNNSPLLNRHQPNQGIVLPVSTKIIQPKFTQKDIHSSSDHPTKSSSNLESLQFPFDGIQHLYSFSKTPHLLSLNQDQISKIPLYSLLRQYTFRGLDTSILKAPKYNTKFTQPDYFRQSNILTHSKPSLQLQTHTAIKTKNDNKTNSDTKRGKNTSPQQLLELNLVRWKKSKQNLIRQLKIDNRQTFKKLKKMNKLKIIGNLKLKEK